MFSGRRPTRAPFLRPAASTPALCRVLLCLLSCLHVVCTGVLISSSPPLIWLLLLLLSVPWLYVLYVAPPRLHTVVSCVSPRLARRLLSPWFFPHRSPKAGRPARITGLRRASTCSALRYLEFRCGTASFAGLLDSGAELNAIGSRLLRRLPHKKIAGPSESAEGFNGVVAPILSWSLVTAYIHGRPVEFAAAEFKELETSLVLGMPFIEQYHVVSDFSANVCTSTLGQLDLLTGTPVSVAKALTLRLPKAERDKLVASLKQAAALSAEERRRLAELLIEFRDLWEGDRRGSTGVLKHRIELTHGRPLVAHPRRHPPEAVKVMEEEVEKMLAAGVIRPSQSPYVSEVVLVKKKTGDWRFCVDFRPLNRVTVLDKHPLPRIQDLIRAVRDSTHFVALDLRAGYWQILMEESSIKFTAFRCPRGLFEFVVMPFGLSNAPATFQRAMEYIFGDLYYSGVLTYLDDILVHGRSFDETLSRLRVVLQRLRLSGLTLNLAKCDFFPAKVRYLGHLLHDGRIYPDPKRVVKLESVVPATTTKGIRSLLGLFGHYRQFYKNYAHLTEPLTRLLKKNVPFRWGKPQEESLQSLKTQLTHLALTNPLEGDEYLLETDASEIAVGGIISCRSSADAPWLPIEFASKTLSDTARRWPSHEREAFAIVWALEKFDCYLRGRSFTVHTDCASLQWMNNSTTGKVSRWASRMAEYHMELRHKSGSQMQHVDFLSREIPPETGLAPRMLFPISVSRPSDPPGSLPGPSVPPLDSSAFLSDSGIHVPPLPSLAAIVAAQRREPPPYGKGYAYREEAIYYRGRVWVPPPLRFAVVAACHQVIPRVHAGNKKTVRSVLRVFCWPGIHADVATYIRSCLVCARSRPGIERLQGLFRPHPVSGPFERVYLDLWSFRVGKKPVYVVSMVDYHTRWVEAVRVPDKTASSVSRAFLCHWVCRFGVPTVLVTDQARELVGHIFSRLCRYLGIHKLRTTVYHPEGSGPVESFHRSLTAGLSHFELAALSDLRQFDEALSLVLYVYRSTFHSGIDDSPAFMTHGVDPRPPSDEVWTAFRASTSSTTPPDDRDRLKLLHLLRLEMMAKSNIRAQLLVEKRNEDRLDRVFRLNDLVLIRLRPSETPGLTPEEYREQSKLQPHWSLPYRVVGVHSKGKAATVRSCLTGTQYPVREVHLQNARFINRPLTDVQRASWAQELGREVQLSVLNPAERHSIAARFFSDVELGSVEEDDDNPMTGPRPSLDPARPTRARL